MSRLVFRWLVGLCLTIATPIASVRAPEPPFSSPPSHKSAPLSKPGASSNSLPLLTEAQQIRELTVGEANRGYPLRLRAVVTYFDAVDSDFFVEDATAGIWVNDVAMASRHFEVGDLLEIEGVSEDPNFAPEVGKPRFRVLGRAPLPPPRKVDFDALISTREDSQWIELEGVVRNATRNGKSLTLELGDGGGLASIYVLDASGLNAARLIDARVLIQGVCTSDYNQKNQLLGVTIRLSSARQLAIVEAPAADPFDIPIRPLSSLLAFTAAGATEHRVRVQGAVTLRRPKGLFLQDGAQGVLVPGRTEGPAVLPGDRVDLVGFVDPGDYTPVLRHAIYRKTGRSGLPRAATINAREALTGAFDTLRVRMDATLRSHGFSETDRTLTLQDGDTIFEARLEKRLAPGNWQSTLPPGSKLRLTGVCSVDVDRDRVPDGFNILLRSPDDVQVLARPSSWTLRRALLLAAVCGGLALAVLAWVVVLRRRVRRQTEMIRRKVQTEAELQRRFEYAARATRDTIWDWNLLTRQIFWSEGIQSVFGYAPDQVHTDASWWYRRIHPDDAERVQGSLQKAVATGGEQWSAEYRLQRADGSYAHVLDRGYVMYDPSGAPCRMIGAAMDITAQKRAEKQLAHERNLLRTLIDTIPDMIYVKDSEGRLLVVNRALAALLGASSPDVLLGKTDPEEPAESLWAGDQKVMSSGEALINREESPVDSRGNVKWVLTTKVPLRDSSGNIIGLMSVSRDITSRKRAEKEIEKARDAAQAANRAKSEFLANMSHEIRTPLNGIMGMTELALETALDAEQREYLEAVKLSADSLLSVINDILDFSKIEAGKLELSPIEFDLHGQVQEIVRLMTVPTKLKGLRLECTVAADVPRLINGDSTRLRQVLVNLLGNAVKFTDQGEVSLRVFKELEDESGLTLHFTVRDTGIGIPSSKQRTVFEAFAQADGSTTRRYGGTGLGLTISKRLVQMMGGRIWVESEEGHGSQFHFTACFRPTANGGPRVEQGIAAGASRPPWVAPGSPGQRRRPGADILLAEDDDVNRVFLVRQLEKHGHHVVVARDGPQALEAFSKRSFNLILLDLQMPGMDGLEAATAIRELEKDSGRHVPIVALTAHAFKDTRERCQAAGMDGFISKPVQTAEMFETIEGFLTEANDSGILAPPAAEAERGRGEMPPA